MGIDREILKRYGFPTALAMMLAGLVAYLVHAQAQETARDLEFIMRLVDSICTK